MSKEKIVGIYCIENKLNHKKYIGQSRDIMHRWRDHKRNLNKNSHDNRYLQNAWNKYGSNNFLFYILEKCGINLLDDREKFYISSYNTHAHSANSCGYNLTIGGEGIGILSDEERQVYREAQQSKPIYQINIHGKIVEKWSYGAREASKALNISQPAIWHCLNKNRKTYKGFIWIYVEDYDDSFNVDDYINQNTQARRILQFDMYGNYVKTWDSATKASENGYDPSLIIKVCKRKYGYYKDSIWCYENDNYITNEYIKSLHEKDYINMYDKNNILIGTYTNQIEIARLYGLSKSGISQCLNGKLKTTKGYHFSYSSIA